MCSYLAPFLRHSLAKYWPNVADFDLLHLHSAPLSKVFANRELAYCAALVA